jgi:hypothetical protein
MGKKNRQPTITVGRHTRSLPVASPAAILAAQVETREKQSKRERELERQVAAEQAAHEATKLKHSIDDVVLLNAQAMKLDKAGLVSLDRSVDHALRDHLAAGKALGAFDPFAVVNAWKARHGRAFPLPPKNASPLDAQLPPPRSEARVLPNDRAGHDASLSAYQERSARHRERDVKYRERYDAKLRELGLTPPDVGFPGNGQLGY